MKQFLLMLLNDVGHPVFSTIVNLLEAELHKVLQSLTDAHPEAVKGQAYITTPETFIHPDATPVAEAESAVI